MLNKEKVSLGIAPIGWTKDSQGQKWEATIRQTRKY